MDAKQGFGGRVVAKVAAPATVGGGIRRRGRFLFECYDRDGRLVWSDAIDNLVVDEGLNLSNDVIWNVITQQSWAMGLKDTGAPAPGDTLGGAKAWSEIAPYSDATRPAVTMGASVAGVADSSASPAVFNINATATIDGAFVANGNVKLATGDKLMTVADFAAPHAVQDGYTLNVTYQHTATAT